MHRLILLVAVLLAACAPPDNPPDYPKPDEKTTAPPAAAAPVATEQSEPQPASPEGQPTEPERPPLDLSLPIDPNIYVMPEDEYAQTDAHQFDASPLFNPEEEPNNLSIMVIPSFKESEAPLEQMPEIDGGSVSVEIKTP